MNPIDTFKCLEQFLKANHMESTLASLRAQLLSQIPHQPSKQLIHLIQKSQEPLAQRSSIQTKVFSKTKSHLHKNQSILAQNLLAKIAYSNKLLQDGTLNQKVQKMMNNKYFQKALQKQFPQPDSKTVEESPNHPNNMHMYTDQLEFASVLPNYQQHAQNDSYGQQQISMIQCNQDESIISQPSYVLDQLNKSKLQDQYTDDNDLGYHQYAFHETQLLQGCAVLTQQYGLPQSAIKKVPKKSTKKLKKKNQFGSKFPERISFPESKNQNYPLQFNGIIYDVLHLPIVYDRQKTGYQETQDLKIVQGDILAGKYVVQHVLGSGVFAKVLQVDDIKEGRQTCLKMISNNKDPETNTNNKDFFDQALDQIKILRYIGANCNPNEHHLLNIKNVFYHRQHLFIETDLLKDNLFVAYRKNPSYFSIPVIKIIARQILQATKMLHSLHIIHADLKPQNILIKTYSPTAVKVIDLGNSCFFHDHLGSYVQSRSYRAPQVVLGLQYDQKIDIWSIGCILAQLWTKNVLFYNMSIQGMLARIQSIMGPWPEWMLQQGNAVPSYFSKENLLFFEDRNKINILIPKKTTIQARIRSDDAQFIDFLKCLLQLDPTQRLTAAEALTHPFLNH